MSEDGKLRLRVQVLKGAILDGDGWEVSISETLYKQAISKGLNFSVVLWRALEDLTKKQKLSELYEMEYRAAEKQYTKLETKKEAWDVKANEYYDKWQKQYAKEVKETEEAKLKKKKEAGK